MNTVHLHLILNHIPVLGSILGLALFTWASWRYSEDIKRAGLGLFLIAALGAATTFATGDSAEDYVRTLPAGTSPLVEQHEEAASAALGGSLVLGILALTGLILFRQHRVIPRWFSSLTMACAILVSGLMGWTANLGGQIRHTEIRPSFTGNISPRSTSDHN